MRRVRCLAHSRRRCVNKLQSVAPLLFFPLLVSRKFLFFSSFFFGFASFIRCIAVANQETFSIAHAKSHADSVAAAYAFSATVTAANSAAVHSTHSCPEHSAVGSANFGSWCPLYIIGRTHPFCCADATLMVPQLWSTFD